MVSDTCTFAIKLVSYHNTGVNGVEWVGRERSLYSPVEAHFTYVDVYHIGVGTGGAMPPQPVD